MICIKKYMPFILAASLYYLKHLFKACMIRRCGLQKKKKKNLIICLKSKIKPFIFPATDSSIVRFFSFILPLLISPLRWMPLLSPGVSAHWTSNRSSRCSLKCSPVYQISGRGGNKGDFFFQFQVQA